MRKLPSFSLMENNCLFASIFFSRMDRDPIVWIAVNFDKTITNASRSAAISRREHKWILSLSELIHKSIATDALMDSNVTEQHANCGAQRVSNMGITWLRSANWSISWFFSIISRCHHFHEANELQKSDVEAVILIGWPYHSLEPFYWIIQCTRSSTEGTLIGRWAFRYTIEIIFGI